MGRLGVTYSEVELVAEKLLQQNEIPTIERVRHLLGTGSNSTISKYLNEWKQQRLRASVEILPPLKTPSDPVNEAVKKVWQELQAENESKIKEIEVISAKKIEEAITHKEVAQQERDKYIADNRDLRDLLKEERLKNADLEKLLLDLQQTNQIVVAEKVQVENAFQSFKDWGSAALDSLQAQNREAATRYEQQLGELEKVYIQQINDIKDLTESHRQKLIVEIDGLVTENSRLEEQLFDRDQRLLEIKQEQNSLKEQIQHVLDRVTEQQAGQHQEILVVKAHIADGRDYQSDLIQRSFNSLLSILKQELDEQSTSLLRALRKTRKVGSREKSAKA